MRTKGTKYETIHELPPHAKAISLYASIEGIRNPAYVCVKYDRFLAGKGTYPGYDIKCWQGMNMVIPEK